MSLAYFDSSAFVMLLAEEAGSDLAAELWDACDAAVASRLAYPEVVPRSPQLPATMTSATTTSARAERAWDGYLGCHASGRAHPAVELHAGQLAQLHALRGADAVHLASALAIGDRALSSLSGTGACTPEHKEPASVLPQRNSTRKSASPCACARSRLCPAVRAGALGKPLSPHRGQHLAGGPELPARSLSRKAV